MLGRKPAWPYVLPFALLMILIALEPLMGLGARWSYPARALLVLTVLLVVSRGVISLAPSRPVWSALLGMAVFVLWIAPDVLFPDYRDHWLFRNALTGAAVSTIPGAVRTDPLFLCFRVGGAVLLIPIVEELFWRAWLMRRLISPAFEKVPLGAWSAQAFWGTALLFASEHGVFWDVGLAAGIVYNWWMLRTRSLADCILAHAVTNGCLAAYVLSSGNWRYWL
jgi:CAAX prenyl protease-like protein